MGPAAPLPSDANAAAPKAEPRVWGFVQDAPSPRRPPRPAMPSALASTADGLRAIATRCPCASDAGRWGLGKGFVATEDVASTAADGCADAAEE